MTPKDKLTAALEAFDHARRALESLAATATGDDDIDDFVADAADIIEAEIAGAAWQRDRLTHLGLEVKP